MRYTIEFFRYTCSDDPHEIEVVRTYTDEFDNLGAAKAYGLANTGAKDSRDKADGFQIRQGDRAPAEFMIGDPG